MSKCKFKVGDDVIIETPDYNSGIPTHGTVSKIIPGLPYPIHVKIPGKQEETIFTSDGRFLLHDYHIALSLANKLETWTVILLYPEYMTDDFGADIYVSSAEADDPYEAVKIVQQEVASQHSDDIEERDPNDFRCIGVIKGEHDFVLDATSF